jgi:hypothetical protein
VKPTALLADALLDVTARGDIVIDPFLGSGSTLVAAERTGRRCRGVEIDSLYVDVIIRRGALEQMLLRPPPRLCCRPPSIHPPDRMKCLVSGGGAGCAARRGTN